MYSLTSSAEVVSCEDEPPEAAFVVSAEPPELPPDELPPDEPPELPLTVVPAALVVVVFEDLSVVLAVVLSEFFEVLAVPVPVVDFSAAPSVPSTVTAAVVSAEPRHRSPFRMKQPKSS